MNYNYRLSDYIRVPEDPVCRWRQTTKPLGLHQPEKAASSGIFPIFSPDLQHSNFGRMIEWGRIRRKDSRLDRMITGNI